MTQFSNNAVNIRNINDASLRFRLRQLADGGASDGRRGYYFAQNSQFIMFNEMDYPPSPFGLRKGSFSLAKP